MSKSMNKSQGNKKYSIQACKLAGGKLAYPIISELFSDTQCSVYVEPFCGTAVTMLNKVPCKKEIISDIDSTLIDFLIELRDNPDRIANMLIQSRYDMEAFVNGKSVVNSDSSTRLEKALAFAITSISSFDYNNVNFRKNRSEIRKNGYVDFYVRNIYKASSRLSGVDISAVDYKKALTEEVLNNSDVAVYMDPPHNKRQLGQSLGFDKQETEEMIEWIKDSKAYIGITAPRVAGNPYDRILGSRNDWRCYYLGSKKDFASALDSKNKKIGSVNMWLWTNRIPSLKAISKLNCCFPVTTMEFYKMFNENKDMAKKKFYTK